MVKDFIQIWTKFKVAGNEKTWGVFTSPKKRSLLLGGEHREPKFLIPKVWAKNLWDFKLLECFSCLNIATWYCLLGWIEIPELIANPGGDPFSTLGNRRLCQHMCVSQESQATPDRCCYYDHVIKSYDLHFNLLKVPPPWFSLCLYLGRLSKV